MATGAYRYLPWLFPLLRENRSILIPHPLSLGRLSLSPSVFFPLSFLFLLLFFFLFVSFPTSHIHTALFSHNKRRPFACAVPAQKRSSLRRARERSAHPRGLSVTTPSPRRDKPPLGIRDCLDLYACTDVGGRPCSELTESLACTRDERPRIDRSILRQTVNIADELPVQSASTGI